MMNTWVSSLKDVTKTWTDKLTTVNSMNVSSDVKMNGELNTAQNIHQLSVNVHILLVNVQVCGLVAISNSSLLKLLLTMILILMVLLTQKMLWTTNTTKFY